MRRFTSWVVFGFFCLFCFGFVLLLVFLFGSAHVKLNLKLPNLIGNK